MSAPTDPTKKPTDILAAELLAHLAGEGRVREAHHLALQLYEVLGHEAADALWRNFYGRGLHDED